MKAATARWLWVIAGIVILTSGVLLYLSGTSVHGPDAPATDPAPTPPLVDHAETSGPSLAAATPWPITITPTAAELDAVISDRRDPEAALQGVNQLISFFRQALGENPVGQNEDITAALLGENSRHAAFLPPNSSVIKNGKLLDPWGTPYWFHPVSAKKMEIRSAGPDREIFTADDLILDN